MLEHLHPDDCKVVIGKIFRALRPGGLFVNIVPNWLTGPHDVSVHFSQKAEGLHLREYDNGELSGLMRAAGFTHCTSYIGAKGFFIPLPSALVVIVEKGLRAMPRALRRQAAVRAFSGHPHDGAKAVLTRNVIDFRSRQTRAVPTRREKLSIA